MLVGNRYELHEQIGAGGMGTVFRGLDTQSGEKVAIKRLKEDVVAQSPAALHRFRREAEVLRQLNHPNIVKVLATADQDGHHFIIMEYIGGGSLRDTIAVNSPMPISRIVSIALDLADALTRAHRLNIIHRDLKPANVLLADDGTPRLTDFGIAHIENIERVTDSNSIVGTLDYLAPEALKGSSNDPRGDIWSFGVMLFEMLAGKRPFLGETTAQVLTGILTQPLPDLEKFRPDVPIELIDLTYRMLDKDPESRIASIRAVGLELETIMTGKSITRTLPVISIQLAPVEQRFATPAPSVSDKPKHNLPAQTTPFVGREVELNELEGLLDDSALRLITILAPGGMGKTRLAQEAGRNSIEYFVGGKHTSPSQNNAFQNGVYFVSLAPLSSSENMVATIAEAVGFQFYPGGEPKPQLLDFFREKRLLLIMDNFEHLLDGVGLLNDILQAAPGVKILATSRQRLNLSGETIFNLDGMDFPDWETPEDAFQYSALKLFMQSARRSHPTFELQADDLQFVARICRLVEGMPLGILLAASWIQALTLAEIADEIGKGLDFLATDMSDVPTRQRSFRAVFDYSWNLLTENERILFSKFSVFRGGFTREASQIVAQAGLRDLIALVNKALLRRDARTGRYEMHELLRQYAEERLQAAGFRADTMRQRCVYYAGFLQQREAVLKGRRQLAAVEEIETDFDNIRQSWYQAIANEDINQIARCLFSLDAYAAHRSRHRELDKLFLDAEARLYVKHSGSAAYGRLLAYHAVTLMWLQRMEEEEALLKEALAIARAHGDDATIALCSMELVIVVSDTEQFAEAQAFSDESIRIYQTIHDQYGLARALFCKAYLLLNMGKNDEGYAANYESLEIRRALGDELGIASSLTNLALASANVDESETLTREALTIRTHLNNQSGIAYSLMNLSRIALRKNDIVNAQQYIEASAQTSREIGYAESVPGVLLIRGEIALTQDDFARTVQLTNQYINLRLIGLNPNYLLARAFAFLGLKDLTATRHHLREYWRSIPESNWSTTPEPVVVMGCIVAEQGQIERGLEWLSLALNHPNMHKGFANMPLVSRQLDAIKEQLGEDAYAAVWERGKTLDLKTVVDELLKEET